MKYENHNQFHGISFKISQKSFLSHNQSFILGFLFPFLHAYMQNLSCDFWFHGKYQDRNFIYKKALLCIVSRYLLFSRLFTENQNQAAKYCSAYLGETGLETNESILLMCKIDQFSHETDHKVVVCCRRPFNNFEKNPEIDSKQDNAMKKQLKCQPQGKRNQF